MSVRKNGADRTHAGGRASGAARRRTAPAPAVCRRGCLVAAAVALLVVGGGTAASQAPPMTPAVASPPIKGDDDHDKVFDDLEATIAATPATAALPVIVTTDRAGDGRRGRPSSTAAPGRSPSTST